MSRRRRRDREQQGMIDCLNERLRAIQDGEARAAYHYGAVPCDVCEAPNMSHYRVEDDGNPDEDKRIYRSVLVADHEPVTSAYWRGLLDQCEAAAREADA